MDNYWIRWRHGKLGYVGEMDIKLNVPQYDSTEKRYVTVFRQGSLRNYFNRDEFSHPNCLVSKYLNFISTLNFAYKGIYIYLYIYIY